MAAEHVSLSEKMERLWSDKVREMLMELKAVRLASNRELARGIGIDAKTLTNIITHNRPVYANTARKVTRYYCDYFKIDPRTVTHNIFDTPTLDKLLENNET